MPETPTPASLREFEESLIAGLDPVAVPSVAYGVMRGEETLLLGATGVADKARGLAATTRTSYSLASVTKPMTTTAVRILAERGLVDLDAPIDAYLGGARLDGKAGDARAATVRHVADHTAGLPLFYTFFYEDEPYARPPFDETVRRYAKLFTPVGERHHYSNLGYGLLDALVSRVSGVPYVEFMRREIFEPLGMTHSAIDAPTTGEVAVAYGADGVGYPRYDFDHPGGSSAFASVEDLLTFGRFHLGYGPEILSREARREMQVPTTVGETREYGLGWAVHSDCHGLRLVGHTGGMGGVNTILRLVPELDLTVAILVNGETPLPFRADDDAIAALHAPFRDRLIADRAEGKPEKVTTPLPSEWHGLWSGVVETSEARLPFTLEIRGGTEAVATLDGREAPVEELRLEGGYLRGVFDGDVRTPDAGRREYRIHLDLALRGETINGAAVTISKLADGTITSCSGGAPGQRRGNALAYWTELTRA